MKGQAGEHGRASTPHAALRECTRNPSPCHVFDGLIEGIHPLQRRHSEGLAACRELVELGLHIGEPDGWRFVPAKFVASTLHRSANGTSKETHFCATTR